MIKQVLTAALLTAAAIAPGAAFAEDNAAAIAALGGDAKKGEKVFKKCKACHVADAEKNKVGPHLVGIIGRPAAAVEDFKYSDAMKESGVTWTAETIAAYLKKPKDYIPKNKMSFAGLRKEKDINNILAYLLETSGETK
ncbi:MAG: cytochrome c family protein [Neomegalonema sp.]|nr:cytochrome c family protein [Neomegalonema sp.]